MFVVYIFVINILLNVASMILNTTEGKYLKNEERKERPR